MVKKCRSCKVLKWNTDPCNNPDCGSISIVVTAKCRRGPVTSRRAAGSYDLLNEVQRQPKAVDRPYLGDASYVADFDGQHYIG
jgi:hypothetical protein